ncbi:ArdC family protein [Roseobacter weihaiensis]|uniref:ArdC family protein n=1 Tax=Roseobacter weihaiensis TaxID=2763262 RepID=UPI001D0AEE18|nr:zincin-like metallopeptidase domain-containing protein [Roseobacter sp. H9]
MVRTAKFDAYAAITRSIIAALESGSLPWRKRWIGNGQSMPKRVCGTAYRGINVLALWAAAEENGYSSPFWMTYRQASELGGQVRKREKSSPVVKYGTFERTNEESGLEETVPYLRAYRVFNADQIDGLDDRFKGDTAIDTGVRPIPELEDFFGSIDASITHGGCRAYYDPESDVIRMPPVAAFISERHYYATLSHEVIHWTGHTSRLNRLVPYRRKSGYAKEELVAEIGACFLGSHIGVEPMIDEVASYLDHWLKAIGEDKKLIFRAAAQAQKAVDLVLSKSNRFTQRDCSGL